MISTSLSSKSNIEHTCDKFVSFYTLILQVAEIGSAGWFSRLVQQVGRFGLHPSILLTLTHILACGCTLLRLILHVVEVSRASAQVRRQERDDVDKMAQKRQGAWVDAIHCDKHSHLG